jgi:hypothetical protein
MPWRAVLSSGVCLAAKAAHGVPGHSCLAINPFSGCKPGTAGAACDRCCAKDACAACTPRAPCSWASADSALNGVAATRHRHGGRAEDAAVHLNGDGTHCHTPALGNQPAAHAPRSKLASPSGWLCAHAAANARLFRGYGKRGTGVNRCFRMTRIPSSLARTKLTVPIALVSRMSGNPRASNAATGLTLRSSTSRNGRQPGKVESLIR